MSRTNIIASQTDSLISSEVKNPVRRNTLILIFIVFFASRLIFFLSGIRFDARTLNWWWHFIDPVLLKSLAGKIHAGNLIKHIAEVGGGRGGGRPDMAEGGTDLDRLDQSLDAVETWIKRQL